jgi:magnesium transporter
MSYRRHRKRHYHMALPPTVPGADAADIPLYAVHSPSKVIVLGYGPSGFEETVFTCAGDITAFAAKWPVVWVDIDGLGNKELNTSLAEAFGLDRLAMEDILDTRHFPKIEIYENYILMILKNGLSGEVFETEQISMILMQKIIITFQERPGDSFNKIRERIRAGSGKIRQFGSDYLAYALTDAIVEGYYPILEAMKQRLDAIEDTFIEATGMDVIRQIHDVKNDLLFLHSAIWPIYAITLAMSHDDTPIVTVATAHYLRDCQDQAKRVTDLSEFYRLIASDLMNVYLAFNDNKANDIMKVLTMVATIFIPLSFIASLYGMNFDRTGPYSMPELGMRYGYPAVLLVMLLIATGLLLMFWRRGWFGHARRFPTASNGDGRQKPLPCPPQSYIR